MEKGQNDKQRSTKHTHETKDRVTRTTLQTSFICSPFIFFISCHIVCLSLLFYELFVLAFVSTIHRLHINRAGMIVKSMPITYIVVRSNPAHSEVYFIQHLVIEFVSELW